MAGGLGGLVKSAVDSKYKNKKVSEQKERRHSQGQPYSDTVEERQNDQDDQMTENTRTDNVAPANDQGNASPSEVSNRSDTPSMTVESPPSTPGLNVNGDRTNSLSGETPPPSRGQIRSSSSKFANLRAAFEQGASTEGTEGGLKRRLASSSRASESTDRKGEYEAEIARLKDQLEKEKELRIAYEEKVTSMEEEIDELNSQEEVRDEELRDEYERRALRENKEADDRFASLQNETRNYKQEVADLQRQLSELKKSVSSSTRMSAQVSDSTFKQEMGILQHEVQNWVVNNFRRVKSEASPDELCERLERVTEPKQLERLHPIYTTFEQSVKLPMYQATVACYMMEVFEDLYLFGLYGKIDWSRRARQAADALAPILEPATYNRWRSMTFDIIRQSVKTNDLVESAIHGITEMCCITLHAMTEVDDSETRFSSLKSIVKRTVSLAHLIRVQQAQYGFILPAPGEQFDSTTMDDISDASDGGVERSVRCTTFPSIVKIGDEEGDRVDMRNLIVKAKVLCNDSEP